MEIKKLLMETGKTTIKKTWRYPMPKTKHTAFYKQMETSGKGLKPRCLEQTGSSSPSPLSLLPPSQQLSSTSLTKHTMSSHQTSTNNTTTASSSSLSLSSSVTNPSSQPPSNETPLMDPFLAHWYSNIHGRIRWEDILENIDTDFIPVIPNDSVCENRHCDGLERCLHAEHMVQGKTPDNRTRNFYVCKNCSKKKYVNHYRIYARTTEENHTPYWA